MSDRWRRYMEFLGRDPRRDFDDEMRAHIELRVADLVARGMSRDDALARARTEFGDVDAARERTLRIDERVIRRHRRADWLGDLSRDVRTAFRSLRNSPSWSVTAVLCAALGIGVTAAIVSTSYAILVRPLPFKDADRLVAIYSENATRGYTRTNVSWPDFVSWRDGARTFDAMAIWTWNTQTLADDANGAERVEGAEVSAILFPMLGVQPMLGRHFAPEEETIGRHLVVLLSHSLWMRRFAGDSGIVGKPISIDGRQWTVVGVMPPGFNFPDRGQMWIPFATNPATEVHGNRGYAGVIARLRPGVTVAQAKQDLGRVDAALAKEFPDNVEWTSQLIPMRDDLVGDLKEPLRVFLAAVGLVFVMVCANLANLMLARGASRSREVAVRAALGASRVRLMRQLLTESCLVAGTGGVLGIAIAAWGVRLIRFAYPDGQTPYYVSLGLDGATVAIVAIVTLATGVLFGALPALRDTRVDLNSALRDGGRGAGSGLRDSRLLIALVVGELGLSVVVMVGALLLVRSYRNLQRTDLGFEEKGILSARYTLPRNAGYPTRAHVKLFTDRLIERLRAVPGVAAVGAAQGIPFSGWNLQSGTEIEGAPVKGGLDAHYQMVTPDYFKTIGVPLVRGRWPTDADRDSMHPVVVVNELLAKSFPGGDPIGKRVHVGGAFDSVATVVGVVKDYRHYRLPQPMGPAAFFPYASLPVRQMTIVLRTGGDPRALIPSLRDAVREIDPRVALYQVQTFEEVVSRSLWRQRLQGNVLSVFAALSLVLACIGLYGVVTYAVAQRTRELGVRMALGATRGNVLRLIVLESGRLVAGALAIGIVGAWFAVRLLASLLHGVAVHDAWTFVMVPLLLGGVAMIAALIPSRRATRVDPLIAMRAE